MLSNKNTTSLLNYRNTKTNLTQLNKKYQTVSYT